MVYLRRRYAEKSSAPRPARLCSNAPGDLAAAASLPASLTCCRQRPVGRRHGIGQDPRGGHRRFDPSGGQANSGHHPGHPVDQLAARNPASLSLWPPWPSPRNNPEARWILVQLAKLGRAPVANASLRRDGHRRGAADEGTDGAMHAARFRHRPLIPNRLQHRHGYPADRVAHPAAPFRPPHRPTAAERVL